MDEEHLVYTEGVGGSNPSPPTILFKYLYGWRWLYSPANSPDTRQCSFFVLIALSVLGRLARTEQDAQMSNARIETPEGTAELIARLRRDLMSSRTMHMSAERLAQSDTPAEVVEQALAALRGPGQ